MTDSPSELRDWAMRAFGGRCVNCSRPASILHHLTPGAGRRSAPRSGVVILCVECNEWAHHSRGGTKASRPILEKKRLKALERRGVRA